MLEQVFGGNSVRQWLVAGAILAGAILLGRVLSSLGRSMGKRSHSKLLASIAGGVGAPVTSFVFVLGVRIASESLVLSPGIKGLIEKGTTLMSVVILTWFVASGYDAIHSGVFEPYAKKPGATVDLHLFVVLRTILNVVVWIVGLASALNSVGFEVSAILAGLGIGGMALALASQDTVANVFGGLLVLTQRPFKVGDRIEVAGINGWVHQFGLRNTVLKNWYGRSVLVPNKKFTDSIVINIDSQSLYYQEARLRLDPSTSAAQVEQALQILRDIVRDVMLLDKTPWVMLDKIDQGFFELEFWYGIQRWTPQEAPHIPNEYEKICRAKTQVNLEILKRFEAASLKFAFPLVVHIPGDPEGYMRQRRAEGAFSLDKRAAG